MIVYFFHRSLHALHVISISLNVNFRNKWFAMQREEWELRDIQNININIKYIVEIVILQSNIKLRWTTLNFVHICMALNLFVGCQNWSVQLQQQQTKNWKRTQRTNVIRRMFHLHQFSTFLFFSCISRYFCCQNSVFTVQFFLSIPAISWPMACFFCGSLKCFISI